MKADNVLIKSLRDGQWFVQGIERYAIIQPNGTLNIYAKKTSPNSETFNTAVKAIAEWCARNPPTITSDPETS